MTVPHPFEINYNCLSSLKSTEACTFANGYSTEDPVQIFLEAASVCKLIGRPEVDIGPITFSGVCFRAICDLKLPL